MTEFNFKKWNTITGWVAFAIALVTFSLTVEPTLSFWDCGEYISTAAKLEVGHPPGAPLFQMIGAFFAMFALDNSQVALMVNMMFVFSSAFTMPTRLGARMFSAAHSWREVMPGLWVTSDSTEKSTGRRS